MLGTGPRGGAGRAACGPGAPEVVTGLTSSSGIQWDTQTLLAHWEERGGLWWEGQGGGGSHLDWAQTALRSDRLLLV